MHGQLSEAYDPFQSDSGRKLILSSVSDKWVSLRKVTRGGDASPIISSAMTDMKLHEGIHEQEKGVVPY